ncbi:hypothetical protein BV20DRAFT_981167 [Pilatotrama ljubarskyi]|nr:hypothetical protein BV20DRAFT_981167 [Pilatotrama ljubarskyi]
MVKSLPAEFYSDFLSAAAKARKPSPIRGLYPLESHPGMISLLAGKPNSATFPLTSVQLKARSPTDPKEEVTTELSGKALAEGLQYGPTAGLPSLIEWIHGLQEREHGRRRRHQPAIGPGGLHGVSPTPSGLSTSAEGVGIAISSPVPAEAAGARSAGQRGADR